MVGQVTPIIQLKKNLKGKCCTVVLGRFHKRSNSVTPDPSGGQPATHLGRASVNAPTICQMTNTGASPPKSLVVLQTVFPSNIT